MSATHPGYAFDVAALLGIGTPSTDSLPAPIPGEILLRMPAGLTLQNLRNSPVGQEFLWQQDWYDKYAWSSHAPPAGIYHLKIPVPDSNWKIAEAQDKMLSEGETSAPVVLTAIALSCIKRQLGLDPLEGASIRCLEQIVVGSRVALSWSCGRLYVSDCWNGYRSGGICAASVRTS